MEALAALNEALYYQAEIFICDVKIFYYRVMIWLVS